jgi:hypothetical protein
MVCLHYVRARRRPGGARGLKLTGLGAHREIVTLSIVGERAARGPHCRGGGVLGSTHARPAKDRGHPAGHRPYLERVLAAGPAGAAWLARP